MFGGGEFRSEWTFHDPRHFILKLERDASCYCRNHYLELFGGLASDSKVLARMDGRAFYLTSPFKIYSSA
jgi:hypothetical protein